MICNQISTKVKWRHWKNSGWIEASRGDAGQDSRVGRTRSSDWGRAATSTILETLPPSWSSRRSLNSAKTHCWQFLHLIVNCWPVLITHHSTVIWLLLTFCGPSPYQFESQSLPSDWLEYFVVVCRAGGYILMMCFSEFSCTAQLG